MVNYYNEHDPKAAAWLRELIKQKQIPAGHVDERSITQVQPHELSQYTQCHFFAGIGGWSYALQLAGIPSTQPVWTGSCPCQPFSTAGEQKGVFDERHLWPAFFNLISKCKPEHVFGEQVANAIGHGWLDGISADLEGENYSCGAAVLGAHSVGAPHIRQRLYWVANADNRRLSQFTELNSKPEDRPTNRYSQGGHFNRCSDFCAWSATVNVKCRDGKIRRTPIESSLFPLAHGIPGRVGLLRGSGNAIVPQTAAAFITASFEALDDPLLGVW